MRSIAAFLLCLLGFTAPTWASASAPDKRARSVSERAVADGCLAVSACSAALKILESCADSFGGSAAWVDRFTATSVNGGLFVPQDILSCVCKAVALWKQCWDACPDAGSTYSRTLFDVCLTSDDPDSDVPHPIPTVSRGPSTTGRPTTRPTSTEHTQLPRPTQTSVPIDGQVSECSAIPPIGIAGIAISSALFGAVFGALATFFITKPVNPGPKPSVEDAHEPVQVRAGETNVAYVGDLEVGYTGEDEIKQAEIIKVDSDASM